MGNEHEQGHASPTAAEAVRDHDNVEPGQSSHSSLLRKPDHAISSGLVQRDARGSDEPSNAQRGYFSLILVPMWQAQLGALSDALRHYRTHLLALSTFESRSAPGRSGTSRGILPQMVDTVNSASDWADSNP